MSDFNSSLPIRTEANGDAVIRLVDGSTTSQYLAIDAAGLIGSKLYDAAGTGITSQVNGSQQALDVGINVAGVQIDPRSIRALTSADVVTADQGAPNTNANGWFVRITDGTNNASVTAGGALDVSLVTALPAGANNIGSVNQGTSPWIVKDQADGSPTGGTAGTFSQLAGAIYNSTLPTLTTGQQAGLQADSSGRLLVSVSNLPATLDTNYGTVGASTLRTASQIGNASGAADFNFGAIGAQSLRVASQIGNATGAANFNNGATGAQTLRVAANLAVGGADVSNTNPVPVTLEASPGTPVNDYKAASSIAAAASDNHDYTVTAGKTLFLNQVESSGSGKAKMLISVETAVASGTFTTRFVQFNSTSDNNMHIKLENPISVAAGVRVRVVMTNRDLLSQDLYSTISGYEI